MSSDKRSCVPSWIEGGQIESDQKEPRPVGFKPREEGVLTDLWTLIVLGITHSGMEKYLRTLCIGAPLHLGHLPGNQESALLPYLCTPLLPWKGLLLATEFKQWFYYKLSSLHCERHSGHDGHHPYNASGLVGTL